MKHTPFGKEVRMLRLRLDLPLKAMADHMQISSSYLSGIEYGEKRLLQKHIDAALNFFRLQGATEQDLAAVDAAGQQSKDRINTADMDAGARGMVAAFARKVQDGHTPPAAVLNWINKQK